METLEFNRRAYEVVSLIENGISSLILFSLENKKIINLFADLELSREQTEIRRSILSVYTRYQGKVDFRDKNNPKNHELKQNFLDQLAATKKKLEDL
ncbi:hypothetical protein ASG89_33425 [Paenibacillus sp. Soil766]|uniref:hypothetical protein n=1 Tax=Paenibacillus sp. Soil766 TaxID=1736404 RepID=UPI00070A1958|nr:hypothetical protein [Paenibacillus sp. Soil766]KRE92154.1 hypothetical protein ASG89_33425 [Paenibacillus sp. Soil766]